MDSDTLTHYGVPGMKWGVRRSPEQLGRPSKRRSKKLSLSKKIRTALKSKSAKNKGPSKNYEPGKTLNDMTDDEIRQRIARLELEKRYKDLAGLNEQKKTSRGKAFCVDVLETIGKNTLTNLGTQAANHIIGDAINRIGGVKSDDVVKRIVNPQKGQTDKK